MRHRAFVVGCVAVLSWVLAVSAQTARPQQTPAQPQQRTAAPATAPAPVAADLQAATPIGATQLQAFFNANARVFGGQVKVAHILVQHRDGGTGILLADEGFARANDRLADIRARLRPDGSNFEEVAARSDDTRTAHEGGLLGPLHRFDDRMPAALCRAAWNLRDGQISDVVESQYGWHIIKRLDFSQQIFMLFTDDAIPSIRQIMRRALQEERLFQARKTANVQLLL